MSTVKVVDLIKRAQVIVQDKTSARWPEQEWLDWYNDAVLAVINARPDASITNGALTLTANESKQSLPANAIRLMTLTRNIISGVPIRHIQRTILDDQIPDWHNQTGSDVLHFTYDERDPEHFYCHPAPATADHQIEAIFSITPQAVTIADGTFETDLQTMAVNDTFVNAILDFMIYRAYSKDAEYAENGQRAVAHFNAHRTALDLKTQTDTAMADTPNR